MCSTVWFSLSTLFLVPLSTMYCLKNATKIAAGGAQTNKIWPPESASLETTALKLLREVMMNGRKKK